MVHIETLSVINRNISKWVKHDLLNPSNQLFFEGISYVNKTACQQKSWTEKPTRQQKIIFLRCNASIYRFIQTVIHGQSSAVIQSDTRHNCCYEMINCLIKLNAIAVFVAIVVSGQKDDNLLLLVSYDAFRPEYFDRNVTPFMNHLRSNGAYTNYLRNVFPTKTFTNHHTISTGLFPEQHGVLGNTVYDVKQKKQLKYGYEMFHYKEDITPIWVSRARILPLCCVKTYFEKIVGLLVVRF